MWVLRAAHAGKEAKALTGQEVVPDVESEELPKCMTYIQEKLYEVKTATGARGHQGTTH